MQIPKCKDVQLSCVKCGEEIKPHEDHHDTHVNVAAWDGAVVATAFASFKSGLQGSAFVIGICDFCLMKAKEHGTVQCFHDDFGFKSL